jgi:hypothetical protein
MYCATCGTHLAEGALRCPKCRCLAAGQWLNLYSLLLLVFLGLINFSYFRFMFPIVVNMATGLGLELPLLLRLYAGTSHYAQLWGWLLIPMALIFFLLKKTPVRVPAALHSGKVLAVTAAAGLLISIVGIMVGYIQVLIEMPQLLR